MSIDLIMLTDHWPPAPYGRSEKMFSRFTAAKKLQLKTSVFVTSGPKGTEDGVIGASFPLRFTDSNKNISFSQLSINYCRSLLTLFEFLALVYKSKPKVIYTTNNPVLLHLFGGVASSVFRVKWVVELRDSWLEFHKRKRFRFILINYLIENLIRKKAKLIFWHKGNRHTSMYWRKSAAGLNNNIHILPPIGSKLEFQQTSNYNTLKPNIGYIGNFYGNEISPLNIFCYKNHKSFQKCNFLFIGDDPFKEACCAKFKELVNIKYLGRIFHDELINSASKLDLLILFPGNSDGVNYAIPTKFFDYLMLNKIILVIGTGNYDLLREQAKNNKVIFYRTLGHFFEDMDNLKKLNGKSNCNLCKRSDADSSFISLIKKLL